MSTYRPRKAPARRVYHQSWRKGYLVNSRLGSLAASSQGYGWIDNDFHLSRHGEKWVNAHGSPERFWAHWVVKFELRTWAYLSKIEKHHGGRVWNLRSGGQALRDNAKHNLNTEFEVKDVRPEADELGQAFQRLRAAAIAAYGSGFRRHVTVKVLTNLSGGVPYALKVCEAAHAAGFPTMVLARGSARFRRFSGNEVVTWVRGSAVVR